MRAQQAVFVLVLTTVIFLATAIGILWSTSPESAGILEKFLLYISIFFSLAGIGSLGEIYLRRLITKDKLRTKRFIVCLRHGILFSFVLVGFLVTYKSILNWFTGFGLILFVLVIESYFMEKN